MKSIIYATFVCGVTLFAQATNFQVAVGATGIVYTPNTVEAVTGDTVEFIVTGTHSIAEAAFDAPCQPLAGGAWSGISPKPNFVITVTDTSPRFFYCTVDGHCPAGMVFALNPSGSMSFSAFQSAAEKTTSSSSPPGDGPVGGTFGLVSAPAGGSSSSSGTVTTSAAAASPVSSTESSTTSGASAAASPAATTSGGTKSGGGAAPAAASSTSSSSTVEATSVSSSPATVVASLALKQLGSVFGCILLAAWYFM